MSYFQKFVILPAPIMGTNYSLSDTMSNATAGSVRTDTFELQDSFGRASQRSGQPYGRLRLQAWGLGSGYQLHFSARMRMEKATLDQDAVQKMTSRAVDEAQM